MKNKFIYLAILAAGFASCEPEFENDVDANYTSGNADFTSYVAVGNSLTAGYMDGTVYKTGQMNSYPNMLAQQFALVGGGSFTQPYYGDDANNLGGLTLGGVQIASTRLVIDASEGRPENITGTPTIEVSDIHAGPYNNMGVPGAKSFHLVANGYGNVAGVAIGAANPYFVRMASSSSTSVLADAMAMDPTFFTNWIGSNDVLAYATNGGAQDDGMTPAEDHNETGNMDPSTYGGNDITNAMVFGNVYSTIVNTLTSGGAKGVVATIPSVTSIPYFTTVPYAPLSPAALGGQSNIDLLNANLYGPLDAVFTAYGEPNRINPLSSVAVNPILIYDADAADRTAQISGALQMQGYPASIADEIGMAYGKARQANTADLVVLPASSVIGTVNSGASATLASLGLNINGVSYPMANRWVLTANEKAKVAAATDAFNATIVSIANTNDLAVADMNTMMNLLVNGLRIETGQIFTADYFSGIETENEVLFSLDGVHPNAKGYAVITNSIINLINQYYNANLPLKYVNDYPGIHIVGSN
ncbi:G-D-S-L family lipolytic protein [Flavobacterium sediminis]|uniref:G-D-S-L family lipolytic protein n=1 Tax=Flavobacterium sediminis TaxID=2201181 RepID=A0A2U8QZ19_9FLAO|nr:G-D-S-L family lipolytic protein [Flavobacterium sediminis]AWM15311.1 G-D-S-L family lipolytic protein [Flavobacterium sediminis]